VACLVVEVDLVEVDLVVEVWGGKGNQINSKISTKYIGFRLTNFNENLSY
jgi:hypothetical protein